MKPENIIDYSLLGEDIDSFAQKSIRNFEHLFELVNFLHSKGATLGLDETETVAGEIRINPSDNGIYIRNADNDAWVLLGYIAKNFGVTPKDIGAIKNGGGVGALYAGTESDKNLKKADDLTTNDIFLATDTLRAYRWTGTAWQIFFSKNFADILDYEQYCVAKSEVNTNGKGKIPRLDATTGKGNFDIAGSPDRIFDKEIDFQNLQDGHAIVYNASKGKWVNLPNYTFTNGNLTYTGEASTAALPKIVAVGTDGKIHGDFTGNTDHIDDKKIIFESLKDGDAIVFNAYKNAFTNQSNYFFTESNLTYTGETSTATLPKIVAVGKDGKIHGVFSGTTDHIGNIEVVTDGVKNNWVLAYNSAQQRFEPVGKITGNADELAGIKIELDTSKINNDDVLAYDSAKDKFVTAPRDSLTGKNITTTGEAKKIVKVADDGIIYGKFSGSNSQIADTKLDITNLTDGDILVYHVSTNTFKNEPKNVIQNSGTGASLILYDRTKVIGDYNGSKTVSVDISKVVSRAGTVSYVNHSMRLIENLYLALDFNNMNYGGRDGLISEFFKSLTDSVDKTSVKVISIMQGDDSIDVDSVDGLIVGAFYQLIEGTQIEEVRIKELKIHGFVKRIIFENPVTKVFTPGKVTELRRSTATFGDGFVTGEDAVFTTKYFQFDYVINRAHMTVKHQNIPDTEISAEMAMQHDAEIVKDEIIGIGDGTTQTVTLANTLYVSSYGFNLYFDGVKQTSGFVFSPTDGQVTFTAGNGVIVQADYIYNFKNEKWIPMHRALTYPDTKNHDRATTQLHYAPAISENTGKIAAIRLKIKSLSGTVTNEILGTGNGDFQGFKLAHHALPETISVSPATATWTYKENLDTIVINAPDLDTIKISYDWKARPVKIDSFAVIFNE